MDDATIKAIEAHQPNASLINEARLKRIESHKASVVQDADGKLHARTQLINIADGYKINKLISVVPHKEEKAVSFKTVPHLFADLTQMNCMLTNACNLSCSYCYEQHRKDFGRFTVESLKKCYDWLNECNTQKNRVFQFFGGEPLIHKKLIKDFITTHEDELTSNYFNYTGTYVSMCTNGLLVDDDFVDFYFSRPFTHMMISLDTFNSAIDHREITPVQLDKLVKTISKITEYLGDEPQRLIIRATLSEETAVEMEDFIERLYQVGVRNIIVHPLILDSKRGYIKWADGNWAEMRRQIFDCLDSYEDMIIKFSEGVGEKQDNNCMVGSDMIAIDASGDFSGCYFFTNQKGSSVSEAILGNIFDDKIYVDRYAAFQAEYNKMFEVEEQCKACDLQNFCYQCPAGNLDTGSKKMFRPDDMCQEIVKLYLDFQKDVYDKMFYRNMNAHIRNLEEQGYSYIEKVLADFKLDTKLSTKDNYINVCKDKAMFPNIINEESDYITCFYLQTLILLLK